MQAGAVRADARDLLLLVLGRLSTATGLHVVIDGVTTEVMAGGRPAYQPDRHGDRWAPVLVGRDEDAKAVPLHELGHVVGLDHVTDPFQIMFDTNSYPLPSYRAGDRRGLELLGMGRCYDDN